jgi:hypothetical protein
LTPAVVQYTNLETKLSLGVGVAPKLEKTYDGPYVIKVKMSKIKLVLQLDSKGTEGIVHHNKLKLYNGVNPSR